MNEKLTFNVSSIIERARRLPMPKLEGVSISLPFISFNITSTDIEQKIAKEIIIRLRDKRVLVAFECCDNCINNALQSIQEIRQLLVDKQVELSDEETALFIVLELMLVAIRQFLTFTEQFDPNYNRTEYQNALELLRGHLLRCISEIAIIGNTTPRLSNKMPFDKSWDKRLYLTD